MEITQAAPIQTRDVPTMGAPPRACGAVALAVAGPKPGGPGETRLSRLSQSGSLKCLFPYPRGLGMDAVLVNTAGGITGGDRFETAVHAGAGTTVTVTTQACERAYAASPGAVGRLETRLSLDDGARLDWIPQETILFDHTALTRRLTVTMAPGASALICEPVLFGRAAMGEELRSARFHDRIEIRRDGVEVYRDAMRLDGDIAARLDAPHGAGGARALATLVYVGADAEAHLAPIRAGLPETGGASLIGSDLLALRLLASDGYDLRRALIPVLTRLTDTDLPKPWMI